MTKRKIIGWLINTKGNIYWKKKRLQHISNGNSVFIWVIYANIQVQFLSKSDHSVRTILIKTNGLFISFRDKIEIICGKENNHASNLTKSLQYIIYFLKTAYIEVEHNSGMYSSWYGHVLNAAKHSYSSRSGNWTDLHVSRVGPLSENLRLRDIVVTWWKGATCGSNVSDNHLNVSPLKAKGMCMIVRKNTEIPHQGHSQGHASILASKN